MATSEAYASLFTGDELDYAIAHALGNKYRGNVTPGCHLIGESADTCVDLDDLLMTGKYTISHYINGPAAFLTEENGTSYEEYDPEESGDYSGTISRLNQQTAFAVKPIYIQVYATGGDHLYQTIMVGAKLYWRDMWSAENILNYDDGQGHVYSHIPWRCVDLGIESSIISNTFEFMDSGVNNSLSQRMGTAAIDYVRRLAIGNANLLDFTNGFFMYSLLRKGTPTQEDIDRITSEIDRYWNISKSGGTPLGSIATVTYEDISDGDIYNVSGEPLDIDRMPLFDDIDDEIMTLFKATSGECAFANYTPADVSTNQIINKISVSPNTYYTASVYVLYDSSFIDLDDTAEAYITIGVGNLTYDSNRFKTASVKLNRLGSELDYTGHVPAMQVPEDAVFINPVYGGTDYEGNGPASDSDFRHYNIAPSQLGYYRLSITLDPNDYSDTAIGSNYNNISIAFGVTGGTPTAARAIFVLPKVEYGMFATQYNHSWGDLYYYFTNCEAFFGVPIDVSHPSEFEDQDSFVYVPESGTPGESDYTPAYFSAEPVAVGGGGGFVVHKTDDLTVMNDDDKYHEYNDDDDDPIGTNTVDQLPISYSPTDSSSDIISQGDQETYADLDYGPLKETYPRYKSVLFLNKMTKELLCWEDCVKSDGSTVGGFVSINKPFVIRDSGTDANGPKPVDYDNDRSYIDAYVGKNQFWLHKEPKEAGQDHENDAYLKYFDPDDNQWHIPKTTPSAIYVVQSNAPDESMLGKLWINSTTGVMYYSIIDPLSGNVVWKPVYAAWGSNPAT